ncbi:hypothetical protein DSO57_1030988 [Entomophthora muscae]|uniref:Uncharacterized protein n=1 Tax=Entomophthora muscae TaxID=34485 RepID=A0ACC2SDN0_9FUNG|nr:hypothetical protein DSO57_1030988 [Entomophthora muscae]
MTFVRTINYLQDGRQLYSCYQVNQISNFRRVKKIDVLHQYISYSTNHLKSLNKAKSPPLIAKCFLRTSPKSRFRSGERSLIEEADLSDLIRPKLQPKPPSQHYALKVENGHLNRDAFQEKVIQHFDNLYHKILAAKIATHQPTKPSTSISFNPLDYLFKKVAKKDARSKDSGPGSEAPAKDYNSLYLFGSVGNFF